MASMASNSTGSSWVRRLASVLMLGTSLLIGTTTPAMARGGRAAAAGRGGAVRTPYGGAAAGRQTRAVSTPRGTATTTRSGRAVSTPYGGAAVTHQGRAVSTPRGTA